MNKNKVVTQIIEARHGETNYFGVDLSRLEQDRALPVDFDRQVRLAYTYLQSKRAIKEMCGKNQVCRLERDEMVRLLDTNK